VAYDEGLAERIRSLLGDELRVTEKKMFGGVAFLLDGKMFVGIVKNDLMARVGPDAYQAALKQPHTRPMDFTGKPMEGYVFVAPPGTSEDDALERWIRQSARFAATLPEKKKPARASGTGAKSSSRKSRRTPRN
jgi:TfoX/Sxy family transcriptional regulator of competence genes